MKGKGKAIATKGKNREREREREAEKEKEKEREWEREREEKGEATDLKDCPLQFPDFTPIDHTKSCPRYTAILQKKEDDAMCIEDLDPLQLELETLLSTVTRRMRELDNEKKILINWQEKKEIKKPNGVKTQNFQSFGKRGKMQDERPNKKFRGESSCGSSGKSGSATPGPGRPPKSKNAKLQEYEFNEVATTDAQRVPKNDAPNRFWASVEPYCADITQEDIKMLEDLVKVHEEDSEYYKIPGLGKHYSIKWAQEDLLEEQKESAKLNDKRRGLNNSSSLNATDSDKLLKKAEKECDESSPFGALTQRLVACLIEENIMTPMDDTMSGPTDISEGNVASIPLNKSGLIKSLNISNSSQLERRIKRELEEQGIFEAEDNLQENPDDEILAELRKCQSELRALTTHNLQTKRRLLKLAKEEMTKQELRRKLQMVDAEVMDSYRRITVARQKKKALTKKEREQTYKALRERENIIKTLSQ